MSNSAAPLEDVAKRIWLGPSEGGGVGVKLGVGVLDGVSVGVSLGVKVAVSVGVNVGVSVGVSVEVNVGDGVSVGGVLPTNQQGIQLLTEVSVNSCTLLPSTFIT
jgi:hypothetical protein